MPQELTMSDPSLKSQYDALKSGAGFVELPHRGCIRLTGADRQSFFHNFCTNDIKQLGPGQICEAFVLNSKGKILGFVHAVADEDELLLLGHGDQGPALIQHLDMYLIREKVELSDASSEFCSLFTGQSAATDKLLFGDGELPGQNEFANVDVGGVATRVLHLELAGFGYLLMCQAPDGAALKSSLADQGLIECAEQALEILRVEQKTPWFGIDVDDSNLPQELQRDDKAISFNKGCYLGQETVARIDARGRVNQLLVGLKFPGGTAPAVGDELFDGDAKVGRVTSVVRSFDSDSDIGLGYVRRKYQGAGTELKNAIVIG
jgi:folate-binding protein YgfZ